MRISEKVDQLNEYVKQTMKHSFLKEYVTNPILNQDKGILAYCLLKEADLSDEKLQENYAAIMLVQQALDTHETILHITSHQIKERQLTVLAGDYYSSLYYYMLSHCEDIPLIRSLSIGIQDVNEQKMSLFYASEEASNQAAIVKNIESALLRQVALYVGKKEYIPFIEDYLLITAVSQCPDSPFSPFFDSLKNEALRLQSLVADLSQPQAHKAVTETRMRALSEASHHLLREEG
ncbi:heptaprenyl diphosphate synthase component I [Fictibacillus macauensis ZFHKF-1]|uniref:Heptaprenyl diphosphate synthase component I n=2 Tax=Fictibacillus TaxID=1329200 RepID=I8J490_9BACL|nr:heptaprenyl diphosphate synthase component I [Fictibacillus macauensis ZFHKF-1]